VARKTGCLRDSAAGRRGLLIEGIWSVMLTVSDLKDAAGFYESVLGPVEKYEFNDHAEFDCGVVGIGVKTCERGRSPGRVNRASTCSPTAWTTLPDGLRHRAWSSPRSRTTRFGARGS
jgi:catechol 2,3-dioxygenase-like lactoylglutathione lyase family enzyme